MDPERLDLAELTSRLNTMAISAFEVEGAHASMFFLRAAGGGGEMRVFEGAHGLSRSDQSSELAAAAGAGVDAVVLVGEALSVQANESPSEDAPNGLAEPREVLLVAGLDRDGRQVVFESTISRAGGAAEIIATNENRGAGYEVAVFDGVRAAWGLPRRIPFRDGELSAEVPPGWSAAELEDVIELETPDRRGAAHISLLTRRIGGLPVDGEAAALLQRVAQTHSARRATPTEIRAEDGLTALWTFEKTWKQRRRLTIGTRISPTRAIVYTYNDDGSNDDAHRLAIAIFESITINPAA